MLIRSCYNKNYISRCQDYILIDRGQYGTTEICGTEPFISRELKLNEGKFKVFFRTSEQVKGEGFQMYIICFQETERDMEGNNCSCMSHFVFDFSVFSVVHVLKHLLTLGVQ